MLITTVTTVETIVEIFNFYSTSNNFAYIAQTFLLIAFLPIVLVFACP